MPCGRQFLPFLSRTDWVGGVRVMAASPGWRRVAITLPSRMPVVLIRVFMKYFSLCMQRGRA